jgi:hypothetical protein
MIAHLVGLMRGRAPVENRFDQIVDPKRLAGNGIGRG